MTAPMDICGFDYYIIDRYASQAVLAQYNLLIAQKLLNNSWFSIVHQNELILILQNKENGRDCIEPGNIQ